MANIYPLSYPQHHQLDFPRGINRAPSPLGFGFGLPTSPPSSSLLPNTLSPHNHHQVPPRPQKRRIENEDDESLRSGDYAMDRSPTPERPKRGPPKRLRIAAAETSAKGVTKDASDRKESKPPSSDIDVGVLLASLPQQSLLPLMMALLREQPGLKPVVLSLLPRPTLDIALQALAEASKTLRDAFPYSAPPSIVSSSFGFGNTTFQPSSGNAGNGGMRESYIISRLRPHITEFVSACFSYLHYFSYLPATSSLPQAQVPSVKPHAAETFTFLSTLMSHIYSQPQLTQNELTPLLNSRLLQEWRAWIDRVDEVLNREGGMFSGEVARGWDRSLDEFADKDASVMKEIRDMWVTKVGWLVGRRTIVNMDEDEEL
ncbi:hypothetical protein BU17DRAFT_38594 [Hysterangium stoloniferum]|nr:hypothetical protein BU17DRAFT_38594 [Hysterangium stoloniferum]